MRLGVPLAAELHLLLLAAQSLGVQHAGTFLPLYELVADLPLIPAFSLAFLYDTLPCVLLDRLLHVL